MSNLNPNLNAGLTAPTRRASRMSVVGQTAYLPTTNSNLNPLLSENSKSYPKYPSNGPSAIASHRIPLHLRIPSLFRTKIPLIAVLPFFLLGYLFAPLQRLDPKDTSSSSTSSFGGEKPQDSVQNRLISYQQGKEWAQRFIYPSPSASAGHVEPVEHFTEKDGLLYFPPASPEHVTEGVEVAYSELPPQRHPILHLIEKAEQDWEDLLNRQSSTLEQAITEYKRRYKRSPPKGFDAWWKFATENKIQLVDEYDTIMRDIEPFFALPPRLLGARAYQLAHDPNFPLSAQSFTMNINGGKLEMTGPLATSGRAEETRALLEGIAKYLPDMQATFTGHDGPGIFLAGEKKEKYIEYARAGKYFTEAEAEETGDQAEHHGWSGACPPGSNWRRSLYGIGLPKPSTHSLISDVEESCDVCKHPDVATQHGFFLWTGPLPSLLYPLFTWAKTSVHSDILVTPLEQYHLSVGPDPKWDDKPHNKLLWRGSTTGAAFNRDSHWRSSQRSRLVLMASEQEGHRNIHWSDKDGVLRATEEPLADLNKRYLDVAFTGRPAQCNDDDGTCAAMARVFNFQGGMDQEEANQYKYIFDMDGNGWSGRFHRLLMSNSAILKSTIMPEWYQQRIKPWVHYVPVKVDYTDLYDILAFFVGGPDGRNGHDELGRKIAKQGQEWAKYHWREVDMQAYLFRLFLEYSRLLERTEADPTKADHKA